MTNTIEPPGPDHVKSCLRNVSQSVVDIFIRVQRRQPVRSRSDVIELATRIVRVVKGENYH